VYGKLAESMGQDGESVKKYYEARGQVDSLKEELLKEKTLNYLVDHANISEVERAALSQGGGLEQEDK